MSRILIIDDDGPMRDLLAQHLIRGGHQVAVAANGSEGLAWHRKNKVDLVITDLMMPEKDGLEVIMELRRIAPQLKVIAISGGMRANAMNLLPIAEKLGAVTTLAKPFQRDALLAAVATALRLAPTPKPSAARH